MRTKEIFFFLVWVDLLVLVRDPSFFQGDPNPLDERAELSAGFILAGQCGVVH
jgi:hypothetical protein